MSLDALAFEDVKGTALVWDNPAFVWMYLAAASVKRQFGLRLG